MNAVILVILVLVAKAPDDMAIVGRFHTMKDCIRAAALIDASTHWRLVLSCKEVA